jgi:glyoxylase-like metal-dependent hydrolase (beta-lactamase superfamily II)
MPLINLNSRFIENVFLVDVIQYKYPKVTSSFIFWDKNTCILFDCGTSDDVDDVLNYIDYLNIPYDKIHYLALTHAHFDHAGGMWRLFEIISKKNPSVRILSTESQQNALQNHERHMKAAHSTYGDDVGIMKAPKNDNFIIIDSDSEFDIGVENHSLRLIATPGHTNDHHSILLNRYGKPFFCFTGEACGTNMNDGRITTLPTSMPIEFNYDMFMKSLDKLIALKPQNIGLGHFGAITGDQDSLFLMEDHREFIENFRVYCKRKYEEVPKTKHVVDSAREEIFKLRSDYLQKTPDIFQNNIVALVYGMLIDLGFKENKY